MSTDQLKRTFLGYYIFSPYGVLRPEIYARARDCPSLDSAHPKWDWGHPPKKVNRENLKFALKFIALPTITSGLVGVSPQNIFHTTCRRTGVITPGLRSVGETLLCRARPHGTAFPSNCGLHHCLLRLLRKNSKVIYSAASAFEDFCLTGAI